MRYVYTIFWHKNMLNFRLNKFHQRATAHISQAQCAWKCKRDTIIYLYLRTLTFTETRLLIWWVKLLNFLLFPAVFLKWTLPRTLHWFANFVPRDSLPKLFAQLHTAVKRLSMREKLRGDHFVRFKKPACGCVSAFLWGRSEIFFLLQWSSLVMKGTKKRNL